MVILFSFCIRVFVVFVMWRRFEGFGLYVLYLSLIFDVVILGLSEIKNGCMLKVLFCIFCKKVLSLYCLVFFE